MAESGRRTISIGDVFQDRYEVLSKISEGGFGEVFRAKQLATGQIVALKTLRAQHFEPHERQLARFRREVKLCAALHHPHIVGLIDFGVTDDGLLYTIFAYVPGRDLKTVLKEDGPLAPGELKRLMGQVLDALSCAHSAGIVHRDLKPGNIMIVSTGARPNAMVLDFGIGAILPSAGDLDGGRLTATFEQLGTPAYAAPELLRGKPAEPASDLYAWGLVYIECMTGKRAVAGKSAGESIHEQLSSQPIAIPAALLNHHLGALLSLATNKRVEHRQITAGGLLRQLERCDVSDLEVVRRRVVGEVSSHGDETGATRVLDNNPTMSVRAPVVRSMSQLRMSSPSRSVTFGGLPQESERRQISAVCFSIEFDADAPSEADVETQDALLYELKETCAGIIERFDGYVATVLGHQTMACFGYPSAHADDARRAAAAGLAIIDEMAASGAELKRNQGIALDVRVGIHTGLVVTPRDPATAGEHTLRHLLGATPGLSMRVQGLADAGSVYVSETTSRLLGTEFALEPRGEHLLGRAGRPLALFQLQRHAVRPGEHKTTATEMGVAMVGREEDLALLRQRWNQARQGNGQAVLVSGEAGIGKSRLVRELGPALGDLDHLVLETRCTPAGRNAFLSPIIELLEVYLEIEPTASSDDKLTRLLALLKRCELEPAQYAPLLGALLDIPSSERFPLPQLAPQRIKALTLDALVALFAAIASDTPLLLAIEDLHWADASTIELIALALEEIATVPMCLVVTARPEFVPPWPRADMTEIRLGRLGADAITSMVAALSDGKTLPAPVLAEIVRRTDGVPLFVEELVRTLLESTLLQLDGDEYRLVGDVSALDIPGTLRDSLMARLDRLGPAKATGQLAAVLGREFELDLLARVANIDTAAVKETLTQLMAAELVFRRRRLGRHVYVFRHALIQDIAYESLPKSVRRGYHARTAAVLCEHFPGLVESRPQVVAHHYAHADEIALAFEYAERAGQHALGRWANAEAAGHMQLALTWLPALSDTVQREQLELRCNMLLMHALMSYRGLAAPELEELVERTEELLSRYGELPFTALVLGALCVYRQVRAEHVETTELAQRYLKLAEQQQDSAKRMDALRSLGTSYYYMGRFDDAQQALEESIAVFDALPPDAPTMVMGYDAKVLTLAQLGLVLWVLGQPVRALAEIERAAVRGRELNSPMSIMASLSFIGGIYQFQGDSEQVRRVANQVIAIANEFGAPQYQALSQLQLCWANRSVEEADAILGGFAAFGQKMALTYWNATVVESEIAVGRYEHAIARVDRYVKLAQETQEMYHLAELYRLKGEAHALRLGAGDRDAAILWYRAAVTLAREQNARPVALSAMVGLYQLVDDDAQRTDLVDEMRAVLAQLTEGHDTMPIARAHELVQAASAS